MQIAALLLYAASSVFSVADLSRVVQANETNVAFAIEATLLHDGWAHYPYFAVSDDSGSVILRRGADIPSKRLKSGDTVRLTGVTTQGERRFSCADCTQADVIRKGKPLPPVNASISDFNKGRLDARFVELHGTIRNVFRDEITGKYVYFVLADASDAAYAAFRDESEQDYSFLLGCTVTVTGICNPDEGGARHHFGRMLIAKDSNAIVILRNPPWWTPARLFTVILVLLLTLVAILVWNRSLRAQVERRSRELVKERLAHIESELKVGERTRLAVELHDTISQNLTGAALEINTVEQTLREDPDSALRHLALAAKTLSSSRLELRNCIWDLRSCALEEGDMSEAIRRTLEPYVEETALTVRFNVPRAIFSDNTAHTLMRIIRELVLNAVRHGHAKSIWIAGSREDGRLLFSVRDNGCGFDPDSAPGVSNGHFGLQGIRERIKKFKGTVSVRSTPGTGAKVTIGFDLPKDDSEKA